jgi:hypothetical protein
MSRFLIVAANWRIIGYVPINDEFAAETLAIEDKSGWSFVVNDRRNSWNGATRHERSSL